MRKILLIAISGISFCTMPVQAQFNTIAKTPERYKVEALQEGMKKPEPTPESMAPAQETSTKPADESKKLWIDRYLSVSYPLQRIRITSPYGYRKDPFTGKRKFHGGIDLHARGEQVLAMMEGVVVKVGQDKTSGKYVTLRHGNYTVSYCHLSQVLVRRGASVMPGEVIAITGNTGRSTGPHLHLTCKFQNRYINPGILLQFVRETKEEAVARLGIF